MQSLLSEKNVSILVVDGCYQAHIKLVLNSIYDLAHENKVYIVFSSSVSLDLKTSDSNVLGFVPIPRYLTMWSLEEFEALLSCKSFENMLVSDAQLLKLAEVEGRTHPPFTENELKTLLSIKYYYVGGSARHMVRMQVDDATAVLDAKMNAIQSLRSLFELTSPSSKDFANTLAGHSKTSSLDFVSQYVQRAVVLKIDRSLVQTLLSAQRAPAAIGCAFEQAMIKAFQVSSKFVHLPLGTNFKVEWNGLHEGESLTVRVESFVLFTKISDLETADKIVPGTMLVPTGPTFPCVDAILFQSPTNLLTFQATIAKKHSVKPRILKQLVSALRTRRLLVSGTDLTLTHIGVVPENRKQFEFDAKGCNSLVTFFTKIKDQSKRATVKFEAYVIPEAEYRVPQTRAD